MKRFLFLLMLCVGLTSYAQTNTWTGAGGNTNWNNTANWSLNAVPTASNDVVIPTGFTVDLNVAGVTNSIVIQGNSTFNMSNNLSILAASSFATNVTVNWNTNSLLGGGTLTNNGTIILNTAGYRYISGGTTLTNNGTVTMPDAGYFYLYDTSVFNNTASGVFDFQSDAIISYSDTNHNFINAGLIKKTAGDGNATIQAILTNTGTISVENGTLLMNSLAKTFNGGVYNVSTDSALILGVQINASNTLTGLLNGPFNWASSVSVVSTATFNFTGTAGVTWTTGSLIGSGTLTNNSNISLATASSRYISGGTTLINNGTVTMPGAGYLYLYDTSVFNNTASGVFDFQSDATFSYSGTTHNFNNAGLIKKTAGDGTSYFSCILNNTGTISVENGSIEMNALTKTFDGGIYNVSTGSNLVLSSQININDELTGVLDGAMNWAYNVSVATAATFNFSGDTGVTWTSSSLLGGGVLTNESSISLSSAGSRYISAGTTLTNNGMFTMPAAGYLYLYDTAVFNNTASGIFDFQSNAIISYSANNHNFINAGLIKKTAGDAISYIGCILTNTGTISVENGTLTMNALAKTFDGGIYNVSTGSNLVLGAQVNVNNELTGVLDGALNWADNVSVATAATFNFTGTTGITWTSSSLIGGGILTNESVISLTTAGSRYISGVNTTLINTGSIILPSAGYLYLYADTTLDNQASGVIDFQSDAVVSYSGSGMSINNSGLIQKTGGAGVTYIYPSVTNSGTINASSGELEFVDGFGLNNTVGGIIKGTATIDLPATANFTNNGTFAPGASPGTLTVLGTYKSSTSSFLDIELDGLVQGTEYDFMNVTGANAIFEGQVNVTLGFDANIGDTFTIATVSGIITTKNLVTPVYADYGCKHYTFDITYPNDKNVLLTISAKEDIIPPDVVTQNITIQLNAAGNASITPSQINNGSTDNCTLPANLILSLDVTSFTCANLGPNTVTLTVEDEAGNSASADAIVTVEDSINPTVVTQNVTVQLDASGNASVTAAEINNSSTDNCSVSSLSLDVTDFTCADLGANTVNLTVEDQSGNTASASATVTVEDSINPTVATQNVTVQLDTFGNASVTAAEINNGSTDNCSVSSLSLDVTDFTCSDLGANTVYLTVEDQSGNIASVSATVTVEDSMDPVISLCPGDMNVSGNTEFIIPDYYGTSEVTASDNCAVSSVVQVPASGTMVGAGTTNVTVTVFDASGNSSVCSFNLDVTLGVTAYELTNSSILMYPNPATQNITLKNNSHVQLKSAIIMDVKGSVIQEINLDDMGVNKTISIQDYASGVYFVKINSESASIVKRLIKQ
jgi:hypothetical protein